MSFDRAERHASGVGDLLMRHSLNDGKPQHLLLLGTQVSHRDRGLACLDTQLKVLVGTREWLQQDVVQRIRGDASVRMPYLIYQSSAGDHSDECRLGGLCFVKTFGVLPYINKDLLNGIFGVIGASKHLPGQRPYQTAILFQAILNGRVIPGGDAF